jgi:hypothetical protein
MPARVRASAQPVSRAAGRVRPCGDVSPRGTSNPDGPRGLQGLCVPIGGCRLSARVRSHSRGRALRWCGTGRLRLRRRRRADALHVRRGLGRRWLHDADGASGVWAGVADAVAIAASRCLMPCWGAEKSAERKAAPLDSKGEYWTPIGTPPPPLVSSFLFFRSFWLCVNARETLTALSSLLFAFVVFELVHRGTSSY